MEQREAKGEGEQHHDKLIAEFPKRFWVQSNIGVQATDSSGVDGMLGFPTGFHYLLSSCRRAAAVVVMTFSLGDTPLRSMMSLPLVAVVSDRAFPRNPELLLMVKALGGGGAASDGHT